MRVMKLHIGLRIGIIVCILALALTAAYYFGTARASSVVALPGEINLGSGSSATAPPSSTASPATTATSTSTTATTPSTGASVPTVGGTATSGTATSSAKSSSIQVPSVQRHVVTTVWDWNCDNGNWGSGRSGSW